MSRDTSKATACRVASRSARQIRILFAVAGVLLVAGCDHATKYQAVAELTDTFRGSAVDGAADKLLRYVAHTPPRVTRVISFIDGFWDFRYVQNRGAAFSLFGDLPDGLRLPVLMAMPLAALLFLLWYVRRRQSRLSWLAFALIAGGGLGNQLDRVRLGYVVDFIHWHWRSAFNWAVFNVADVAIFIGVVLLLVADLRNKPSTGGNELLADVGAITLK